MGQGSDRPGAAEFEAAGLYDPDDEHAAEQLALLDYLASLGGTTEEMLQYAPGELAGLSARLTLWPNRNRLRLDQVAERAGISTDEVRELWRASGFADPGDEPVAYEDDVAVLELMGAAAAIFGRDSVRQLARIVGGTASHLAEAFSSSFVVDVGRPALRADPLGLELAKANVAVGDLLPAFIQAFDVVLRHHIESQSRPIELFGDELDGVERSRLAVGFVDLVESTALSRQLGFVQLGAALSAFEEEMSAQIAAQGGHLVKFIGDEAMFTVSDPAAACRIALSAADAFRAHPLLPQVRAAVAWGDVLRRGGDFFGPTVTLAARAVEHAPPGAVAVTSTVRESVANDRELVLRPLAEKNLKGFDTPVELWSIEWPA